jgi:hypothetical protein
MRERERFVVHVTKIDFCKQKVYKLSKFYFVHCGAFHAASYDISYF